MNALRLLAIFFRLGAMNELQYRANFWIQLVRTMMNLGFALFAVFVVYDHTDQLNGWTSWELVTLMGVWTLMGGMLGVVMQPSMEKLIEDVREGTLDFSLTKPEDAQLLVSVGQVRVWRLVDVLVGALVIVVALNNMGRETGLREVLGFGLSLSAGSVILYSFWLMLSTVAFWFVRIENILMIFHSMYDAARWPVTMYPGWMQAMLTFLVPVAFAVTVPAGALVGRLPETWLAGTAGLAVALLIVSRWFFRVGLRRYSGASA
jgi:ABC-2 type transport system permease protein